MQVSDFIAEFLAKKGIKYVYAVTGGASLHLIHSAKKNKKLKVTKSILNYHRELVRPDIVEGL